MPRKTLQPQARPSLYRINSNRSRMLQMPERSVSQSSEDESLREENELLKAEIESLRKENEDLKTKTQNLVEEDESLKEQLSKKHVCPICRKLYARSDALYVHLQSGDEKHRAHALERYGTKCEICQRDFKRWGDLRKHMIRHASKPMENGAGNRPTIFRTVV